MDREALVKAIVEEFGPFAAQRAERVADKLGLERPKIYHFVERVDSNRVVNLDTP